MPKTLIQEVKQLIVDKRKLDAVNRIKTEMNMSLRDAKDCVDIIGRKGEHKSDYPPPDLK